MENLLEEIPFVLVRADNILVSGQNNKQHIADLEEVLKRLSVTGLRLDVKKCIFMAPKVIYLDQRFNQIKSPWI